MSQLKLEQVNYGATDEDNVVLTKYSKYMSNASTVY